MKLYCENEHYKLYNGNMLDMLEVIPLNSIDAVVTDPPYELGFMNKSWDATGIAFQKTTWEKCFKVLKPGGYLLAFGGSRTFHRIACAIEDAGFEIRDTIMYIFGSGFPKSQNLGKSIEAKLTMGTANTQAFTNLDGDKSDKGDWGYARFQYDQGARPSNYDENGNLRTTKVNYHTSLGEKYDGWGTALKPAYEPIIIARKPCEGSTTDNVIKYGVGGINIDECRIGLEQIGGGTMPSFRDVGKKSKESIGIDKLSFGQVRDAERIEYESHIGRFPSNLILTYDETDKEEVCGGFPNTKSTGGSGELSKINTFANTYGGGWGKEQNCSHLGGLGDEGSAARYFYCAKASKRDRDEGLPEGTHNIHPTVKPVSLCQYLVRLVCPNGGTVLDPFNGSGSTGKAVMYENKDHHKNYKYIGIELTDEYLPISKARIDYALNDTDSITEVMSEDTETKTTITEKVEKYGFDLW